MKEFGRHDNPWRGAPPWAVKLGARQLITILQNEVILAKLEQRECKISPEDQAKLDQIFDEATGITTKIDAAEDHTDPAGPGEPTTPPKEK